MELLILFYLNRINADIKENKEKGEIFAFTMNSTIGFLICIAASVFFNFFLHLIRLHEQLNFTKAPVPNSSNNRHSPVIYP